MIVKTEFGKDRNMDGASIFPFKPLFLRKDGLLQEFLL